MKTEKQGRQGKTVNAAGVYRFLSSAGDPTMRMRCGALNADSRFAIGQYLFYIHCLSFVQYQFGFNKLPG